MRPLVRFSLGKSEHAGWAVSKKLSRFACEPCAPPVRPYLTVFKSRHWYLALNFSRARLRSDGTGFDRPALSGWADGSFANLLPPDTLLPGRQRPPRTPASFFRSAVASATSPQDHLAGYAEAYPAQKRFIYSSLNTAPQSRSRPRSRLCTSRRSSRKATDPREHR